MQPRTIRSFDRRKSLNVWEGLLNRACRQSQGARQSASHGVVLQSFGNHTPAEGVFDFSAVDGDDHLAAGRHHADGVVGVVRGQVALVDGRVAVQLHLETGQDKGDLAHDLA